MYSLSIFILASNETELLQQTLHVIYSQDLSSVFVTVVLKSDHCPAFETVQSVLRESTFKDLEYFIQKGKQLEETFVEIVDRCTTTHLVILGADMEMDPSRLSEMMQISIHKPDAIICASKWHKDSLVLGYGQFRSFLTRKMNHFVGLLFHCRERDLFSIYQIMPYELFAMLPFSHSFQMVYEYTLLPLRAGIPYIEIPTVYRKRPGGNNSVSFLHNVLAGFFFILSAIRIRFFVKL